MDDPARRLHGALHGRMSRAGLPGCLVLLLLLPVLIVTAGALAIGSIFGGGRGRASARRPDPVLEGLVAKLALDDTFTRAEAATAGIPLEETRSVDDLLAEAVDRGWIDRNGDRYAVTSKGRALAMRTGR